jgi:putative transposase
VSRFIDEQRGRFGVEPICRTLGVSASAYYRRATGERSARAVADERLLGQIEAVHAANYHCYGYRRTWLALRREGSNVGRDRVKRLMRANGIQGAKRRGRPWRTTTPDPAAVRPPDRVNRDFTAAGPDRLWVADFCYLRCWDGVVFFAFVIDVWSRRVVGWQLAPHMRTDLVLDALRMALARRRAGADVELVHHSDAGSQYTSYDFGQVLDDHNVLASIGSVGDAYDNALAESFVDSFKTELIADRVWRSRNQLELAVVEYIGWFNHDRLHEALGDIPPVEFEQRNAPQASISGNGSVAALPPRAVDRLYAPRLERERASTAETALSRTTGPGLAGFAGSTHT